MISSQNQRQLSDDDDDDDVIVARSSAIPMSGKRQAVFTSAAPQSKSKKSPGAGFLGGIASAIGNIFGGVGSSSKKKGSKQNFTAYDSSMMMERSEQFDVNEDMMD